MTAADDPGLLRLTNGVVDVDVSTAYGPRILHYGFVGGRNVFASTPHLSTDTVLGRWYPIGGHRLWVAPERMPGSYAPDDRAVTVSRFGNRSAQFDAPSDAAGIEKSIRVDIDAAGTRVVVTHVVTNRTCWPVKIAPWAITVTVTDGTAVFPQPAYRPHAEDFLPSRQLVQWAYTDFADPRWAIGSRLVALRPDRSRTTAQKIGAANEAGWCALLCDDVTFVKHAERQSSAEYPDFGCNTELFTAGDYLELESLAPLRLLEPGASSEHVEKWYLGSSTSRHADEQHQLDVIEHLLQ